MKKLSDYFPKNDWYDFFLCQEKKGLFKSIEEKIFSSEINIYPPTAEMFAAFDLCAIKNVRVIILGQDPYHQSGQANGLAFSVNKNVRLPPSLKNIFKEIEQDLNIKMPPHGDLSNWAKQGVLLLNTSLSVRANEANSHSKIGWQKITDEVIVHLSQLNKKIIFVLWGKMAQTKQELIDATKHLILSANHPSPLSAYRGFFNCKHFSAINDFLEKECKEKMIWHL